MPKTKTIVIIVAIVAAIWLYRKFMQTPKFNPDGTRQWSVAEVSAAFKKVAEKYGVEYARKLEQLFRLEVGHWENDDAKNPSQQWKKTLSPGMVAVEGKEGAFPYGWGSLQRFVAANPKYSRGWYTTLFENTSDGDKYYVGFPSVEASIFYVAWFIKTVRGDRFGYWNASRNEAKAQAYEQKMTTIRPRFN
jgi:hypothetical protein